MQEGLTACVFLEDIVSNGETYIKSNFSLQLWLSSCLPYLLISIYFKNHNQCREHSLQIALSKDTVRKWGVSVLEQFIPPPVSCHSGAISANHTTAALAHYGANYPKPDRRGKQARSSSSGSRTREFSQIYTCMTESMIWPSINLAKSSLDLRLAHVEYSHSPYGKSPWDRRENEGFSAAFCKSNHYRKCYCWDIP